MPVRVVTTISAKKTKISKALREEIVWDPFIRWWHWILALTVTLGWSFGEFMSFATIKWHFYCGYTILCLMLCRVLWSLCGPAPVRLGALLPTRSALLNHLRDFRLRQPSGARGHNPLGSLAVLAMLALLTTQALCGLFLESDDYFESAPLAHLVSDALSTQLLRWHKALARLILIMVTLHIAAVFYYWLWKRENLIKAMITGRKWVTARPDGEHENGR